MGSDSVESWETVYISFGVFHFSNEDGDLFVLLTYHDPLSIEVLNGNVRRGSHLV